MERNRVRRFEENFRANDYDGSRTSSAGTECPSIEAESSRLTHSMLLDDVPVSCSPIMTLREKKDDTGN